MTSQNALLQGHEDVHGLFDFLQSRPHDKDVPQLLSPSPFLHASLKQLRVKDSRSLQVRHLHNPDSASALHACELAAAVHKTLRCPAIQANQSSSYLLCARDIPSFATSCVD